MQITAKKLMTDFIEELANLTMHVGTNAYKQIHI